MVSEASSAETAKESYFGARPSSVKCNKEFLEAIQNNNLEIVKLLWQQSPDVNGPNCTVISNGNYLVYLTPLIYAVRTSVDTSALIDFC